MAGLNDMIRSAFPDGNVGKPLMLALGALLASGILFRGGGSGQTASAGHNRHRTRVTLVECLADWAGC
jgi:hypothetical protein